MPEAFSPIPDYSCLPKREGCGRVEGMEETRVPCAAACRTGEAARQAAAPPSPAPTPPPPGASGRHALAARRRRPPTSVEGPDSSTAEGNQGPWGASEHRIGDGFA